MFDNKKAARTRRIVEEFVLCLFRGEKMMPVLHCNTNDANITLSPPSRSVLLLGRMLNIEFDLRFVDVSIRTTFIYSYTSKFDTFHIDCVFNRSFGVII